MGDPAGIGGEIALRAWQAMRRTGLSFVALDDPGRLRDISDAQNLGVPVREVQDARAASDIFAEALPVLSVRLAASPRPGVPDPANAAAILASIERSAALTMAGETSAVVTNPINKAALYAAGFAHPGHTEFLAELTGAVGQQVMMLACPELRVVPVTLHASLSDAIEIVSTEAIIRTTRTVAAAMVGQFGIANPRLAMAGLNPHAGEGGALGDEEITIIGPAVVALRAEGHDVSGPWPPDTMFTPAARGRYDVAICMYHDQALIPLKTIDMRHGVNVTLGLPIVRTSPDHGTAYDIAGRGIADPASLIAALELAARLAARMDLG
jgi:4-hydroxythreonine-4-phosphate dehydrogenase